MSTVNPKTPPASQGSPFFKEQAAKAKTTQKILNVALPVLSACFFITSFIWIKKTWSLGVQKTPSYWPYPVSSILTLAFFSEAKEASKFNKQLSFLLDKKTEKETSLSKDSQKIHQLDTSTDINIHYHHHVYKEEDDASYQIKHPNLGSLLGEGYASLSWISKQCLRLIKIQQLQKVVNPKLGGTTLSEDAIKKARLDKLKNKETP